MMELLGLGKSFAGKPAIADLSLRVEEDEYLTLLGPSGSGKSTMLRLIAGLEMPDAGQILLNGEDITSRPPHMRGLGFVQQNYALFPHMTVGDNIVFGLRNRIADPVTDEAVIARRLGEMLELVGLTGLERRMVGQISGGQKQRVALARTLITQPKVCLLDEPLGALDANLRERMTVELRKIRKALGVTFFHVTGNESEALAMGDRMILLDEGRAIQVDTPDTVFHAPATVQAAKFVNSYNILAGKVVDGVFCHGDQRLALTAGAHDAAYYALRIDAPAIEPADAAAAPGRASMLATFIASEFMGSRVVHFFKCSDGALFEVERHLSRTDPVEYQGGRQHLLTWDAGSALLFDTSGHRIPAAQAEGAA